MITRRVINAMRYQRQGVSNLSEGIDALGWQIKRRAMNSSGTSSQIPPHPPWATLTSTTAAIPTPASAAINGGAAARPADGRGQAIVEVAGGAPGADPAAGRTARTPRRAP